MKGRMWIALAVALLTAVPGGVLASHLVIGNPETVVTGHTVLSSNIFVIRENPTDFAAIAGLAFVQRRNECVVWFNGIVIFDGSLGPTGEDWKSDSTDGTGAQANDNTLDPCGKIADRFIVMAVEAGDCDPRSASNATFVRDLSFVDPNAQVHEVAEIKYDCGAEFYDGLAACLQNSYNGDDNSVDDDLDNDDNEPEGLDGLNDLNDGDPTTNSDTDDPNSSEVVLTSSCGGALEAIDEDAGTDLSALFREYVWVTQPHIPIIDPTLDDGVCLTPVEAPEDQIDDDFDFVDELLGEPDGGDGVGSEGFGEDDGDVDGTETFCAYNFALIVDTCNGFRCTDGGGVEFLQEDDDGDGDPTNDAEDSTGADGFRGARFDDSRRNVIVHSAPPTTQDEIRDGNSNSWPVTDPDNHREDKTADPCYPPQAGVPDCGEVGETDYDPEEDHLTAQVDLYVSLEGCTGVDLDGDGVDDGARTLVGAEFCRALNEGALTALVVNHPGCLTGDNADSTPNDTDANPSDAFPEDGLPASPVGNCWDPISPPNDAARAGGNSPTGFNTGGVRETS